MIYNHRFYIENSRWYIDLPEYPGVKEDLQMVCGADTLLDILAQGENSVVVAFSTEPFAEGDILIKTKDGEDEGGAYYMTQAHKFELWLCDVTKYVFDREILPETIYYK